MRHTASSMLALSALLILSVGAACGGEDGDVSPSSGSGVPTGGGGGLSGGTGGGAGGAGGMGTGPGTGGGTVVGCSEAGELTYASPTAEDVSFVSSTDGIELFARLHIPEARGRFATVILLHEVCADRTDWSVVSTLAPDLAKAGFVVLHYDARGFGESNNGGALDLCGETSAVLFEPMVADVGDAIAFLATRPEPNLDCLAVAGAGIGANVSLIYGAQDDRVQTTVLLSPGLNFMGLSTQSAITDFDPRASLMFATTADSYSVNTLGTLAAASPAVTPVILDGDAVGAAILSTYPDALSQTLDWLSERL